jgi:hypothetical protein
MMNSASRGLGCELKTNQVPNVKLSVLIAAAFVLFGAVKADADLITSLPGGTVLGFPSLNAFTGGPQTVAAGVTWSSTNANATYGWTSLYGFINNGSWSGLPAMVGTNSPSDSMTFAFSTPVSAIGGILNWAICPSCSSLSSATIAVYDSTHTLIESFTLSNGGTSNLATPNSFYGFSENTADIFYFTLTGAYIGLRDLTEAAVSVPGPIAGAGRPV